MTDLQGAAAQVGGHCWVELRVFEIAGRWVPETAARGAKLALDRHSAHAAWRAGQWEQRLPVLAVVDRQALIRAPDEGWASCCAQLAELPGTVSRLAGLYRVVLPRLALRYRTHLHASLPSAESPSRRSLHLALDDLAHDRDEGDDVLYGMLADRAALEAAAAAVAQLESAFVG